MIDTTNLTLERLNQAVTLMQNIERLQAELHILLNGGEIAKCAKSGKMSDETRAKMKAAQQKRWEKYRNEKMGTQTNEVPQETPMTQA